MARVTPPTDTVQEQKPAEPVKLVPGAMFGFCPKCSAPVEMREITTGGPPWGKDRCQNKHVFPSMQAMARPLVAPVAPKKKGRK
jgi:hypothetical protein